MDVVEPPLDTELYRYGLGMLPAAYFFYFDMFTLLANIFGFVVLIFTINGFHHHALQNAVFIASQ